MVSGFMIKLDFKPADHIFINIILKKKKTWELLPYWNEVNCYKHMVHQDTEYKLLFKPH